MGTKGFNNRPQRVEPSYENICFIDEYPELQKKCWLRRLNASRSMGQLVLFPENQLVLFPDSPPAPSPDTDLPPSA